MQHWTSAKSASLRSMLIAAHFFSLSSHGEKKTGHNQQVALCLRTARIKRVLSNSVRFVSDSVKKCRVHQWWARHIARIYCGASPTTRPGRRGAESTSLPLDAGLLLRELHREPRDADAELRGQRP